MISNGNYQKYTRKKNPPKTININKLGQRDQTKYAKFICKACKLIPLDPIKCSTCNLVWCNNEFLACNHKSLYSPLTCVYNGHILKKLSPDEIVTWKSIMITCECGRRVDDVKCHYATCIYYNSYSCLSCNTIKHDFYDIEKHVELECWARFISCEYCNIRIKKCDEENHKNQCYLKCWDCGKYLLRSQFNRHRQYLCTTLIQKRLLENSLAEEKEKSLSLKSLASVDVDKLLREEREKCQKLKTKIQCNNKSQNNELFKECIRNNQKDYENFKKILTEMNKAFDDNIEFSEKIYKDLTEKRLCDVKSGKRIYGKVFCIVLITYFMILLILTRHFLVAETPIKLTNYIFK
jgi:hypothetical protein